MPEPPLTRYKRMLDKDGQQLGSEAAQILMQAEYYAQISTASDGSFEWSIRQICSDLEMNERTAKRERKRLLDSGYIEYLEHVNGHIARIKLCQKACQTSDKMSPVTKIHRCQNVTPTSDKMTPVPVTKCHRSPHACASSSAFYLNPEENKKIPEEEEDSNTPLSANADIPHGEEFAENAPEEFALDFETPAEIKPNMSEAFLQFWKQYPNKAGKQPAEISFGKACKKHGLETVLTGIVAQLEYWRLSHQNAQFVPHAATWLNKARYLDDFAEMTQSYLERSAPCLEISRGSPPGRGSPLTGGLDAIAAEMQQRWERKAAANV